MGGRTPAHQKTIDGFRGRIREIAGSDTLDEDAKLSALFALYGETSKAAGDLAVARDSDLRNSVSLSDAAGETAQVGGQVMVAMMRIAPEKTLKIFRQTDSTTELTLK